MITPSQLWASTATIVVLFGAGFIGSACTGTGDNRLMCVGCECLDSSHCVNGQTCREGRCTSPEEPCSLGAIGCECLEGRCNRGATCSGGVCRACDPGTLGCECHNGVCNRGFDCEANTCVNPGTGGRPDAGYPPDTFDDVGGSDASPMDVGFPDAETEVGSDVRDRDANVPDSDPDTVDDVEPVPDLDDVIGAYLAAVTASETERCDCYYEDYDYDDPEGCVADSALNDEYGVCVREFLTGLSRALDAALCARDTEEELAVCLEFAECAADAYDSCFETWRLEIVDCPGFSALEAACLESAPELLVCADGGVFDLGELCDGRADCADGSDEELYCFACPGGGTTIPFADVCDGEWDCSSGADEIGCFACSAGSQTVSSAWRCDGISDCDDSSDESVGCEPTWCEDFLAAPPHAWFCDGLVDCVDESDEDGCMPGSVVCSDGTIIPRWEVCDGNRDCPDGADEEGCDASLSCGERDISPTWICDGMPDCADARDETSCVSAVCGDAVCGPSESSASCNDCLCFHGDPAACPSGESCVGGAGFGSCDEPWGHGFSVASLLVELVDDSFDVWGPPDPRADLTFREALDDGTFRETPLCTYPTQGDVYTAYWVGDCPFVARPDADLVLRLWDEDLFVDDLILHFSIPLTAAWLQTGTHAYLGAAGHRITLTVGSLPPS